MGRSEVDAATLALPVPEARGLGPRRAADLANRGRAGGNGWIDGIERLTGWWTRDCNARVRISGIGHTGGKSARIHDLEPLQTSAKTTRQTRTRESWSVVPSGLGVLRVRGVDAVRFLQGQLSSDVERVNASRSLLGGYHNPQGRTIALLRIIQREPGDLLALLPTERVPVVSSRLAKFILRAKVRITDESNDWRVEGLIGGGGAPLTGLPPERNSQRIVDGSVFVRVAMDPARYLVVSPADIASPVSDFERGDSNDWLRMEVHDGIPQVLEATSEAFVAQMLNLDLIDAIAFDKGCYTGQEVIARAHYRGRVKRRMQRFVTRAVARLQPGESGRLADGRTFRVVLAAQLADGRCDFLAVAPRVPGAGAAKDERPDAAAAEEPPGSSADSPEAAAPVDADQAALPYELPA